MKNKESILLKYRKTFYFCMYALFSCLYFVQEVYCESKEFHCQVNSLKNYTSNVTGLEVDSVFLNFTPPKYDSLKLNKLIYSSCWDKEWKSLVLNAYASFDTSGNLYNIKFDRLYNLSSPSLRQKDSLWLYIETGIKEIASTWKVKKLLVSDLIGKNIEFKNIAMKDNQFHIITFSFSTDYDITYYLNTRLYWMNIAFPD